MPADEDDDVPPYVEFIRGLLTAMTFGECRVSVALKRTIFLGFTGMGLCLSEASAARFLQSCWAIGVMGTLQNENADEMGTCMDNFHNGYL